MPNVSIVFYGDQACYILFTQVLKVNLIEIALSYSSKHDRLITVSDYIFVLVEGDYISTVTKLTYAKQIVSQTFNTGNTINGRKRMLTNLTYTNDFTFAGPIGD